MDNIVTVEDPVEYILDRINQVQVNLGTNLCYRSSLYIDRIRYPMIGEIRDVETEIAVLPNGHGISTIHTSDAASTINRLVDMGIPIPVSTSLTGIISIGACHLLQCKKSYEATLLEKEILNIPIDQPCILYRGEGCGICNQTGYRGRVAVHEVLKIDKTLREMIVKGYSTDQIRDFALEKGMVPLAQNAIDLVKQGITTIDEVAKVAFLEED